MTTFGSPLICTASGALALLMLDVPEQEATNLVRHRAKEKSHAETSGKRGSLYLQDAQKTISGCNLEVLASQ